MRFYVEVVAFADGRVVKRLGPHPEWKADRIERGLAARIDDDHYTRQVPEGSKLEEVKP